jgi:HAD superfamily hydrolase (TIGR01549 family)
MSLGKYNGILFDLDGTIWDSENAFVETLKKVLEQASGKAVQKATIRRKLRKSTPIGVMKEFDFSSHNYFWNEYERNYHLVRLFFGNTKTVLKRLLRKRIKLGVVTSLKKKVALDLLRRFGLLALMEVIITPSDTRARKPSPVPVLKALNILQLEGDMVIYVGNSDLDIIAAREAGCSSGLAKWGAKQPILEKPCYVFCTLEELLVKCV